MIVHEVLKLNALIKRVISISGIFLTILVSMHLGIAYHFCMGDLEQGKVMYAGGNADCGMNCKNDGNHNAESDKYFKSAPCCTDIYTVIHLEEYYPLINNSFFISSFDNYSQGRTSIMPSVIFKRLLSFYLPPPLLSKVFLTFIQVFII